MTGSQYLGQYSGEASITTLRVQPGRSSSGSSSAQAASSSTSPFAPGVLTAPPPPRARPLGVLGVGAGVPSLEFGLEFNSACNLAWSWWGGAGATLPVEMGRSSTASISINCSSSIFFLRSNSASSSLGKLSVLIGQSSSWTTHDIKLVFAFFINDILIDLLEPTGKRAPSLGSWVMPY